MTQLTLQHRVTRAGGMLAHIPTDLRAVLAQRFSALLDAAATATQRGTFYNSREELEAAVGQAHDAFFAVDRGLYVAALLLPGTTDYSRQLGVARLLSQAPSGRSLISVDQERRAVTRLVADLPPQRMLKLYGELRRQHVNNARTSKLILRTILGSERLELWSVRYRRKLRGALTHAWGKRQSSVLKAILAKPLAARTGKEHAIVERLVSRYREGGGLERVLACVSFILGNEEDIDADLPAAYVAARADLDAGRRLPYEVLEGIRSRYHRDVPSARVLELTRRSLTAGQRLGMQRQAEAAGVEVAFDPSRYDAVRLYLYAYERGLTEAIVQELDRQAVATAASLPYRSERLGILVDASASMAGDAQQPLRPMAVALACRDAFSRLATEVSVRICGGDTTDARLIRPLGDTSLAEGFVDLLEWQPDTIAVFTDGYENSPAGRFAEVVAIAEGLPNAPQVLQVTPVFAAEAGGIRRLAEQVQCLPTSSPAGIGLGLLRALMDRDPYAGVTQLLGMTLATLTPAIVR